MTVTFRLMQESGVPGPVHNIELENPDPPARLLNRMAKKWAGEQIGHPWDHLTVEHPDRDGQLMCWEVNRE